MNVLIVDDHPLLRAVIDGEADMTLVGEASNGREAVEQYRLLRPDVTVMDLLMPVLDGVAATTAILEEFPAARVVMLST